MYRLPLSLRNNEDYMFEEEEKGVVSSKAYLRHLKQYIQAPVHRFAAIVPPELTSICHDELAAIGFSSLSMTDAGVEFFGKLRSCYLPNLSLRTASRILCRLPPFRAGVVQELFHKVLLCRWELWLNPKLPLEVRAFVWNSRVNHEGLVAETVTQGIRKRFQTQHLVSPVQSNPESMFRLEAAIMREARSSPRISAVRRSFPLAPFCSATEMAVGTVVPLRWAGVLLPSTRGPAGSKSYDLLMTQFIRAAL